MVVSECVINYVIAYFNSLLLPVACCLLPAACCLLPVACYQLPITITSYMPLHYSVLHGIHLNGTLADSPAANLP